MDQPPTYHEEPVVGVYAGYAGNGFHQRVVLTALAIPHRVLDDRCFLDPDFARGLRLVIFPAGLALYENRPILGGPSGEANLRQAVRGGLNYYGVCAGAVIGLSASQEPDAICLGLCRAEAPYGFATRTGFLRVRFDGWLSDQPDMDLWYHHGPLFQPVDDGPGEYRVLARFCPGPDQHPPTGPTRLAGVDLTGQPAIIEAHYGAGRVVLSAPHPEYGDLGVWRYPDWIREWIAQRGIAPDVAMDSIPALVAGLEKGEATSLLECPQWKLQRRLLKALGCG